MGAAVVVIMLVGMVLPISMLLLAVIFDVLSVLWVAFVLTHDQWKRVNREGHGLIARLHAPPVGHARAH